jgi:hypothetical protein
MQINNAIKFQIHLVHQNFQADQKLLQGKDFLFLFFKN